MPDLGLIRSALFVPGNRLERVDKALAAGADAVIIDLEDAVPPDQKEAARQGVGAKLAATPGQVIIVRVNGLDTPDFAPDLAAVVGPNLAGLMVPKIEDPADLERVNLALSAAESAAGLAPGGLKIIALIESARGVEAAARIAAGVTTPPRLHTMALGAADYTLDMGMAITRSGEELAYPRARLAVACRAHDLAAPLDTPFMIDLKDIAALEADAARAQRLGFMGKLCIHPNQVEPVNRVFSPTPEEIAWAGRVVEAFEASLAQGLGAIQVEGKFIDRPVVERARRTLALAQAGPGGQTTQPSSRG